MNVDDVMDTIEQPTDKARQAVYKMLREGLVNGAVIPEVETDTEQAAHFLLGCDNYMAMITIYATADDIRPDEPAAAAIISTVADEHLLLLTDAILAARGPIGEHKCENSSRQPPQ